MTTPSKLPRMTPPRRRWRPPRLTWWPAAKRPAPSTTAAPAPPPAAMGDERAAASTASSAGPAAPPAVAAPPAAVGDAWPQATAAGARVWPRLSTPAARRALAATAALALALWAQTTIEGRLVARQAILALPVVLPLVGLTVAWWWSLRDDDRAVADAPMPVVAGPAAAPARRRDATIALGLLALTTVVAPALPGPLFASLALIRYPLGPTSPENTFTAVGAALWIAAIVLYLRAVAERPSGWDVGAVGRWLRRPEVRVVFGREALVVAAVLAVAAVYRFHDLALVPRAMTSDHVEKLIDIHELTGGQARAFFWRNTGRELFQFYWTALFVWLGGLPVSFLTQKIAMATLSVIAVTFTYGLGRRVAGPAVGAAAALALALCPWDVQITRVALRYELSAVFAGLSLWLLVRALQLGTRNSWLACGAAMAVGLHGYTGFRPILLAALALVALRLGYDAAARRRSGVAAPAGLWRVLAGHVVATAGLGLLLLAPLLRYAVDQPGLFLERALTRTTGVEQALANPPFVQFAINMRQALLMFNVLGDSAWLVNPAGRVALETAGAALFLLGVVTAAWRARRGDWRGAALLATVPLMLTAAAMALAFPNEVPHLARSAGALPAVAVLVALPLGEIARRYQGAAGRTGRIAALVVAAALFVWMGRNTWQRYYDEYRPQYNGSTHNTFEGAEVARGFIALGGDLDHVYLVGWSDGWDYRAIGVELGDFDYAGLLWGREADGSDAVDQAAAHVDDPAAKLYIVAGPRTEANVDALRTLFPAAVVVAHPRRDVGEAFTTVYVPAR